MDAKSKANFINSVAGGQDASSAQATNDTPAFATVNEPVQEAKKAAKYVEPSNAFAQGLPEWSIEPPQVMVRRH